MNNPYHIYNQNVPMLRHTDWASVAKQWASLRADVNIPQTMNEHHNYIQNIPPPPPPPSPPIKNINFSINPYDGYQHITPELINNMNHHMSPSPIQSNVYQTPAYSVFEDKKAMAVKSKCETFDYNHGNRPYEYYNNEETFTPPPSIMTPQYSQNLWNLPPPDHPDIVQKSFSPETFVAPDPILPPKLFPIVNVNELRSEAVVNNLPVMYPTKPAALLSTPVEKKMTYDKFDSGFVSSKPTKGLPAWIIDDMKKMKEKERKSTYHSMDVYRDNPVYSRRDSEGDVVMEDVHRPSMIDGVGNEHSIMSGKNVTKHQIDDSAPTTEADTVDNVSLHDDDDIVPKIDYASKSFSELVELLDDSELEAIKITVIRDSLTDVMKEVTDDMIFAAVKSTFSRELSRGKKSHKHKGRSDSIDQSSKVQNTEAISQLLGLSVYESDGEDDDIETSGTKPTDSRSSMRSKWSSHKTPSDVTATSAALSADNASILADSVGGGGSSSSSRKGHKRAGKRRSHSKEHHHHHHRGDKPARKKGKHHRDGSR